VNLSTLVHWNASKMGRNARTYVEFTYTNVERFTASEAKTGQSLILLEGLPDGRVVISNKEGMLIEVDNGTFELLLPFDEPRERRMIRVIVHGDPNSGRVIVAEQRIPGQPITTVEARWLSLNTRTGEVLVTDGGRLR
jgi:hypothetical protein